MGKKVIFADREYGLESYSTGCYFRKDCALKSCQFLQNKDGFCKGVPVK